MSSNARTWKSVGIVAEGDRLDVDGINPWEHAWHRLDPDPVELPHPAYPNQRHRVWVYEIRTVARVVTFAAGELSANVWGFYIPGA